MIPLVLQTALGKRDVLKVFGDDYPTPDGSCIRDYIHVSDLADAHVQGLRYLEAGQSSDVFNLGIGQGCSVFEVINKARKITGKEINLEIAQRRPGDPPALFASPDKARKLLDWIPRFSEVEVMIEHAWRWESRQ